MALTEKLTAIADAIRSQSRKTDKLTLDQMPGEIAGLQLLNFQVVGGTSAPAAPEANTLWVNTGTAITGWVFQTAQPAAPSAGTVWVTVGTDSPAAFNALKENTMMVYPISAKQYVSGAWVERNAKSYLGGKWVDWVTFFYNRGNSCDSRTGGYLSNHIDTSYGTGAVTFGTGKISLVCDGKGEAAVRTNSKVNLSNFKTLNLKVHAKVVSSESRTGHLEFYVTENAITGYTQAIGSGVKFTQEYPAGTDGDFTVSLDVSGISGSKYIFVSWWTGYKVVDAYLDILEIGGV